MSGFTAVNLPLGEEAAVESLAMVPYKKEAMDDNIANADATDVSSSFFLSCLSEMNFNTSTSFHVCCLPISTT